jgi:cob(I)alamin adenosyltransferase
MVRRVSILFVLSVLSCASYSTSNVSLGRQIARQIRRQIRQIARQIRRQIRQIAYLNSKDRVTTRRFFMPLMVFIFLY